MKQFLILPFIAVSVMAQVTLDVKVLPDRIGEEDPSASTPSIL